MTQLCDGLVFGGYIVKPPSEIESKGSAPR